MNKLLMRDLKKFGILFIGYLILQYVSVFMIERIGILIGNNASIFTEYLYYFLIVIASLFLTLGSLLLFLYLIIKPAIEDSKQRYGLNESIVLYRLIGLLVAFTIGLFNFFVALAVITDFDLKIIFEQSINLYIGFSFGIEAVLSLILIIYSKIYNNKAFVSKLNIIFNVIILLIIYGAGNLYFYYYFQYGMILLLVGYIFIFLNIKLVCKNIFINTLNKVVWAVLFVILIVLFGFSFIKGENLNKDETIVEENIEEKVQREEVYSYENIDSKFGTIKKYTIDTGATDYIFTYNDKLYNISSYSETEPSLNMQGLKSRENLGIYQNETGYYYVEGTVLLSSENSEDTYLTCSGSYTQEELLDTECIDEDTEEVLQYMEENNKSIF